MADFKFLVMAALLIVASDAAYELGVLLMDERAVINKLIDYTPDSKAPSKKETMRPMNFYIKLQVT